MVKTNVILMLFRFLILYQNLLFLHPTETPNHSRLSVFSVVPVGGSIAPKRSVDVNFSSPWAFISVLPGQTFFKAHESGQQDTQGRNSHALEHVSCLSHTDVCVIALRGAASLHSVYLCGGDPLTAPTQSLLPALASSQSHPTGRVHLDWILKVSLAQRSTWLQEVIVQVVPAVRIDLMKSFDSLFQ